VANIEVEKFPHLSQLIAGQEIINKEFESKGQALLDLTVNHIKKGHTKGLKEYLNEYIKEQIPRQKKWEKQMHGKKIRLCGRNEERADVDQDLTQLKQKLAVKDHEEKSRGSIDDELAK